MKIPESRGPGHDVLLGSPDVSLTRCALGLTLFLDEPYTWASQGAAEVLERYLQVAPVDQLTRYTTSMLSDWQRFTPRTAELLLRSVSVPWSEVRVRHLFTFRLVDDVWAPGLGVLYKEMDEARGRRGFLQLLLPLRHDPKVLLQLATEIADRWPVLCGVGGYVGTWNEWLKPTAFWSLYRWSQRFLGMDLQDPDPMSWCVEEGLPGSNWLTLVGNRLAQKLKLDVDALRQREWKEGVRVQALRRATLIQAGEVPTLGDVNMLRYPAAYSEAARALAPFFVKEPPEYWGGFYEAKKTKLWMRRFVDPEALR